MGCGHSKASDAAVQSVKTNAAVLQAVQHSYPPAAPALAEEVESSHESATAVLDVAHSLETGGAMAPVPLEVAAGCKLGLVVGINEVQPPQTDSESPTACSSSTARRRRRAKAAALAAAGSDLTKEQPEQQLLEAYMSNFRFLRHAASSLFQAASDEALWASLPHWQTMEFEKGAAVLDFHSGSEPDQLLLVRHGKVQLLQTNFKQRQLSSHDSILRCGSRLSSSKSGACLAASSTASELSEGKPEVLALSSQSSIYHSSATPDEQDKLDAVVLLGRGDQLTLPIQPPGWGGGALYEAATSAVVMALPMRHAEHLILM